MLNPRPLETDAPTAPAPVLRLKRGEERRLLAGHLWVFSNEVDNERTPLGELAPGTVVQLRSHRDAFLGYAYVNPHALICARILSRDAALTVGPELLTRRLEAALALRERLGGAHYGRWVFGESDLLPGLVLDRYGDLVVGQIATAGMEALMDPVLEALPALLHRLAFFERETRVVRLDLLLLVVLVETVRRVLLHDGDADRLDFFVFDMRRSLGGVAHDRRRIAERIADVAVVARDQLVDRVGRAIGDPNRGIVAAAVIGPRYALLVQRIADRAQARRRDF